jgi:hypothetical protein
MFGSDATDQPDDGGFPVGLPFHFQRVRLPPRDQSIDEPSFSPRLDVFEECTWRAIRNVLEKKNLAAMSFRNLVECQQKRFNRGFLGWGVSGFRSGAANGLLLGNLPNRSRFVCVLTNAQSSDFGFKGLPRDLEHGGGAQGAGNAPAALY